MKGITVFFLLILSGILSAQTEITTNYKGRLAILKEGLELERNTEDAAMYFKKLADTDDDTFLVAARAYGYIAGCYYNDSIKQKLSSDYQLYYVTISLKKYPQNVDAYIDRLRIYKYAEDKTGEAELIQYMQTHYNDNWHAQFELGYHYIKWDFLWPDSEGFDTPAAHFKRVLELNPTEFNTLLLMSVAYEKNKEQRYGYLKRMYQIAPQAFLRNTDPAKKIKYPYIIRTIENKHFRSKDLTVMLTKEDCAVLNLPK
ncbi:MAG: hypothetical protein H7259_04570 [Cytophagales bacterium]|nr:hypothetical protein [Cytophaga sp.]